MKPSAPGEIKTATPPRVHMLSGGGGGRGGWGGNYCPDHLLWHGPPVPVVRQASTHRYIYTDTDV